MIPKIGLNVLPGRKRVNCPNPWVTFTQSLGGRGGMTDIPRPGAPDPPHPGALTPPLIPGPLVSWLAGAVGAAGGLGARKLPGFFAHPLGVVVFFLASGVHLPYIAHRTADPAG